MSLYTLTNANYLTATFATSIPAISDATIMCWLKLASVSAAYHTFCCIVGPAASLSTTTDGVTSNFATLGGDYPGSVVFETGIWYHMAMTITSSSTTSHFIRGYVNGIFQTEVTDTSTFSAWTG